MKEIIIDTLLDSIKILPFLLITFIIIEFFEHKFTEKGKEKLEKSKASPLVGAILGIIPQCGFSVAATNLYSTRIITLGTLISVYLSTSDELLPIIIAEHASIYIIIKILLFKLIIGMICGIVIDLLIKQKTHENYHICEEEKCHCEKENLILSSVKHTINIFIFILICTFLINIIIETKGIDILNKILLKNSILTPLITSLIGLIPNCASSVIITELYLKSSLSFASLISGLLSGAGVGILVLFKTNKNKKENIAILILMYLIGAITGIILEIITKLL